MGDHHWPSRNGEDEEAEEDQLEYQYQFGQNDSLIFLVDCTESMFEQVDEEHGSHFNLSIKCIKNVMTNKIVGSNRDLLAVVFYGTRESKNSGDFRNVYVLQDLEQPGAERVLQLERLLEGEDNDGFASKYGRSDDYSLSDALWTCSLMFSKANKAKKLGHQRVMLFTNNDNPHAGDKQLQMQAVRRAADMQENHVDLVLMNMQAPGARFDQSKFYQDVVSMPEDEDTGCVADPAEKFEELLTRALTKDHKKRSVGRVKFRLGQGVEMGLSVYGLVGRTSIPPPVKLYKDTNEEVKTITKRFVEETGEILLPSDMAKYQEWCGKKIWMDPDEVESIKRFDAPGLTLLGFKPRRRLKRYHHVKPSQFIYPDEAAVRGSSPSLRCAPAEVRGEDVVAVWQYTARRNTRTIRPLLPQKEEMDEHK
ncbi:PREDICTED: X-ray repair cross-complementing protein 5-like [Priapulus caudatus]|uniref:X-ray repair cross-complementing protein 5-like n=1 Tax=Priapulus caudatus TaxID=37621 RepID=A0ABM1ED77_PRICU|nr:PREDICTED: X-ray repair cross-complementing protein 5-like [Priapulus caudatus]